MNSRKILKIFFFVLGVTSATFGRRGRALRTSLTLILLALVVSTSSTTVAAVDRFAGAPAPYAVENHSILSYTYNMNEVNKTLFIPLYGKAKVSRQGIILKDSMAEKIWDAEAFEVHGKSKSKWLTYNMAMRAKIFDDWVEKLLAQNPDALVLHIGCGLDSRAFRIAVPYTSWIDGDFPEVLKTRKKYYSENDRYKMMAFDASKAEMVEKLPDAKTVIVVFEGISMYLRNEELNAFVSALDKKYAQIHMLLDVYTVFGAKASKYKNPINDVGVTTVWGIDDINVVIEGTQLKFEAEHSLTPENLVNELPRSDRGFFKFLFTGSFYRKIYRLYEISKTI